MARPMDQPVDQPMALFVDRPTDLPMGRPTAARLLRPRVLRDSGSTDTKGAVRGRPTVGGGKSIPSRTGDELVSSGEIGRVGVEMGDSG